MKRLDTVKRKARTLKELNELMDKVTERSKETDREVESRVWLFPQHASRWLKKWA
jgi:hypothetical protein